MKFRTTSGATTTLSTSDLHLLAEAPAAVGLPAPASMREVGQVEHAHLLRKQIEHVIREYGADPAKAALTICVILDGKLDLAEGGYFEDDDLVLNALTATDQADD